MPQSTAQWTIYPACATNFRDSAEIPTLNLGKASQGDPGKAAANRVSQVSNKGKTAKLVKVANVGEVRRMG
jgi:hypothetical protein